MLRIRAKSDLESLNRTKLPIMTRKLTAPSLLRYTPNDFCIRSRTH